MDKSLHRCVGYKDVIIICNLSNSKGKGVQKDQIIIISLPIRNDRPQYYNHSKQFAEAERKLAESLNVEFLNLFELMEDHKRTNVSI